jgi:hypothetical protein
MVRQTAILILLGLILSSCAPSRISEQQVQKSKTQVIEDDYSAIFNASLAVINGQGFTVNHSNELTGTIEAVYRFTRDSSILGDLFEGYNPRAAVAIHIIARLTRVDDATSLLELDLLEEMPEVPESSYSIRSGEPILRPVRDTKHYDDLFADIRANLR